MPKPEQSSTVAKRKFAEGRIASAEAVATVNSQGKVSLNYAALKLLGLEPQRTHHVKIYVDLHRVYMVADENSADKINQVGLCTALRPALVSAGFRLAYGDRFNVTVVNQYHGKPVVGFKKFGDSDSQSMIDLSKL